MINKENYNLALTEITLDVLNLQIPSDEKILAYKDAFEAAGIGVESYYYSNLIRQIKLIIPSMYGRCTPQDVDAIVTIVLEKINTLICPINVSFFNKYILSARLVETPSTMTHDEKIAMLEDCINAEPIDNPIFELVYYNQLLGFYLNDVAKYLDKLAAASDRIKELKALRDLLPTEVTRV